MPATSSEVSRCARGVTARAHRASAAHGHSPVGRSKQSARQVTQPLRSDRIPNTGLVPEVQFNGSHPRRAMASVHSSAEFADEILFVSRHAIQLVGWVGNPDVKRAVFGPLNCERERLGIARLTAQLAT